MESVKKSVKNFGKGFGIWLILLLLNTRAGESSVNGIKIIMDTLLSIILIGNNKKARETARWCGDASSDRDSCSGCYGSEKYS